MEEKIAFPSYFYESKEREQTIDQKPTSKMVKKKQLRDKLSKI